MDNTQDIFDQCIRRAETAFPKTNGCNAARDTAYYLAHTEMGESIRQLARTTGAHPSTVMRAVHRVEQNRDDPLFDHVLTEVERPIETKAAMEPANQNRSPRSRGETADMDIEEIRKEARRYLRRLAEPGAFLLIARHARKAGIFCPGNEHQRPVATLAVNLAAEFLKQDWIRASGKGSTTMKYQITEVGRSFLRRTLAEEQQTRLKPAGMAEAPSPFLGQHRENGERLFLDSVTGKTEAKTVNLGESPIGWLTRRKGPDGQPFLAPEEVDAGEKLRNDFETANIGPQIAQDWRKFLTPGDKYSGSPRPGGPADGPSAAPDRVMAALAALGPGLSDVALRTCCFLEGLEACERRMGWSARSGKVVLKLALQRLADHYGIARYKI